MTFVQVTRPATGPRVHVIGIRVHHGAAGLALAAIGTACRKPAAIALGLAAMLHDLHDLPWTTDR